MLSSKWVWYIHAAYTTSSWPVAFTLCASLVVLITQFASCITHVRADTVNLCLHVRCEQPADTLSVILIFFFFFVGGDIYPQTPLQRCALHAVYMHYHQTFSTLCMDNHLLCSLHYGFGNIDCDQSLFYMFSIIQSTHMVAGQDQVCNVCECVSMWCMCMYGLNECMLTMLIKSIAMQPA